MQIIFFILTGAIFGSFSNVIIYRLPRILNGEAMSLSWPGSHCPGCKQPVKVYHNIPLLGIAAWPLCRMRAGHFTALPSG